MADENLTVTISMRDDLSRQVTEATKSINKLGREMDEARKAAEKTGDYSQYDRLKKAYDEERTALTRLKQRRDQATRDLKAMEKQTMRSASRMQSAWKRMQNVFKSPLFTAATIAGVTLFGKRSLEAFAKAETSQMKLVEAYRKFEGVRDVPIDAIRDLASELQSLTGTDDDALAAAAGTLARFELTGAAITRLLPLVNDFAILTGRDVVEASESIGKAFMGNARALKELGINFTATGDRGKDLETIMAALEEKAGGAGEAFGATAQGGLTRAQAAFGDLQEEIGGTLVPALTALLRVVEPMSRFFQGLADPIKGVAVAIGVLAAAALAIGPRLATMVVGMKAAGIEATTMRTKMSAAGAFMTGPWGAAIAVATAALGVFATAEANASAKAEELKDTLDAATGSATQLTRQKIGEEFLKNFSMTELEQTPFTLQEITSAVLEGGAAYEDLRMRVEEYSRETLKSNPTQIMFLGALANSIDAADRDARAMRALAEITDYATDASSDFSDATGGVTRQLVRANAVLPLASYKASDYYQALAAAKAATDGLTQSLSDLSAAVSEWGARDNFKKSLKEFIIEPTADAARTMISNFEQAANAIQDPGERAQFVADNIGKVETALGSSGLKVPQNVLDELNAMETSAARILTNVQNIDSAINRLPDSKTVRFFLETYGRAPANLTGAGDGPRHGGYTDGWITKGAGGPTSDYAPIWASRGEFVLRAGAAAALQNALGDAGMWALNHADRSMPSFLGAAVPAITTDSGQQPALVGAGAPVINIGEIKADAGIDVQTEVMWALRRADRIKRERG